jgi:GNAT superfamily N-acetyltransferase
VSESRSVYREAARSYASLLWFAALLGAGFILDLVLGGGVAHLPGWAIAFVLVLGLNFLVLYAVRSEKSLNIDASFVRVGEQAISRVHIVGLAAAEPTGRDEVPVLGWPTGAPKRVRGLGIRLVDGTEVVVPTRYPQRVRELLGLSAEAPEAAAPEGARAATRSELSRLPEIALRGAALFRAAGLGGEPSAPSVEDLERAAVFVVGRPAVGFVAVASRAGVARIEHLAVVPASMRQGLGGQLVERACEWSVRQGLPAITVLAYADLAWGAPLFGRLGFEAVPDEDVEPDGAGPRVLMRRELS